MSYSNGELKRQLRDHEQVHICSLKFVFRRKPSASKKCKSCSTRFSTSKGQRAVRRNELAGELSERAGREISEKKPAVFLFIISSPPFHYSVISFATVVLPRTARIRIKHHQTAATLFISSIYLQYSMNISAFYFDYLMLWISKVYLNDKYLSLFCTLFFIMILYSPCT